MNLHIAQRYKWVDDLLINAGAEGKLIRFDNGILAQEIDYKLNYQPFH